MTGRQPATRQREVKLTSQLGRGDLIALDGIGGFTVTSVEPYGTQALIKLATASLAVICARDVRWSAITPGSALYLHGYQACQACHGKGIVFATRDQGAPAWDSDRTRWVNH
jgi:mono/diheme cytochrome c family protein